MRLKIPSPTVTKMMMISVIMIMTSSVIMRIELVLSTIHLHKPL